MTRDITNIAQIADVRPKPKEQRKPLQVEVDWGDLQTELCHYEKFELDCNCWCCGCRLGSL